MNAWQINLKIFGVFTVALLFLSENVQSQSFEWAKRNGGLGEDCALSSTFENSGSILTVGSFEGTVDFDPGTGSFNLTALGPKDAFIQKLDSAGNFVWAKKLSGINGVSAYQTKVDSNGNIYIIGEFSGTVDFNPGTGSYLMSSSNIALYLLILDSAGNFNWAIKFDDCASGVFNLDKNGSIELVGSFSNSVDIDPGTGFYMLNSNGWFDFFIAKFSNTGTLIWAKSLGGQLNDSGLNVETDDSLNIYVSGSFSASVDFGANTTSYIVTSSGLSDAFVLKLDSAGNFKWVKTIGSSTHNENIKKLKVDMDGNIILSSDFQTTIDFDPDTSTVLLSPGAQHSMFLLSLDAYGNFNWVKTFDCNSIYNMIGDIIITPNKDILLAGTFKGTVDFDPGSSVYNLFNPSTSMADIFMTKLDSAGNFIWAKQIRGTSTEYVFSIDKSNNDEIIVSGQFGLSCDFNYPYGDTLVSAGNMDFYIAKFNDCQPSFSIDTITACKYFTWINGINYTSDNSTDTYIISGGAVNGCDSIIRLNLTIQTVDTTTFQTGALLQANAQNATYQWLDCSNSYLPISGASNSYFQPSTNGYYAVEITANSCIDTSGCINFIIQGLESNNVPEEQFCYAYIKSGVMTITSISSIENPMIKLYNLNGSLVREWKLDSLTNFSFPFIWSTGMYLLNIISEDYCICVKVVVNNEE